MPIPYVNPDLSKLPTSSVMKHAATLLAVANGTLEGNFLSRLIAELEKRAGAIATSRKKWDESDVLADVQEGAFDVLDEIGEPRPYEFVDGPFLPLRAEG